LWGVRTNDLHKLFSSLGNQQIPQPIILIVTIKNDGTASSIATNWSLAAIVKGETFKGRWATFPPDGITVHPFEGQTMHLSAKDALYNKALNPIPPGGLTRGILMFLFPGVETDILTPASLPVLYLTFEDIAGKTHNAAFAVNGHPNNTPGYIPGIEQ
jgi:hypothetical protein